VAAARLGRSYWNVDEDDLAVTWLQRAATYAGQGAELGTPSWFDADLARLLPETRRVPILLDLARAQLETQQVDAAIETFARIPAISPSSGEASIALARLAELGGLERVSAYQRGLVYLNHDRYDDAIAAFERYLDVFPAGADAAGATYYHADAHWSLSEYGLARLEFEQMAAAFPSSSLAPEALWSSAQVADRRGTRAEAKAAYQAVADTFPNSQQAAHALLRLGWLRLADGDGEGARASWERLGRQHPDPQQRAEGLFLLGRGLLGLGNSAAGRDALQGAAVASPLTFEGLRGRDLASGGLGAEPFSPGAGARLSAVPENDLADCTTWIAGWSTATGPSASSEIIARVDRLLRVGMTGQAVQEAMEFAADSDHASQDRYLLARYLQDQALYPASIFAANRIAAASPERSPDTTPGCLQRIMYPIAFGDLAQQQSDKNHLDPFLLLSLLRQESWFSPRARSGADARGMAQVIPSTAQGIARALGQSDFSADDLYRPQLGVTFGAYYLAQQLDTLYKRPIMALAAYNAGGGSAQRWTKGNPRIDPDDYVEAIDYTETRSYVRSIYQIYGHYRALYG